MNNFMKHVQKGPIINIGDAENQCKDCTKLNMSQPFASLSNYVCNTTTVVNVELVLHFCVDYHCHGNKIGCIC